MGVESGMTRHTETLCKSIQGRFRRNDKLIAFVSLDRYYDEMYDAFWPSLYYGALPEGTRYPIPMELITLLLDFRKIPAFQVGCFAVITTLGICKSSIGE